MSFNIKEGIELKNQSSDLSGQSSSIILFAKSGKLNIVDENDTVTEVGSGGGSSLWKSTSGALEPLGTETVVNIPTSGAFKQNGLNLISEDSYIVSIGNTSTTANELTGGLFLKAQTDASTSKTGYGQLYVDSDDNTLYYVNGSNTYVASAWEDVNGGIRYQNNVMISTENDWVLPTYNTIQLGYGGAMMTKKDALTSLIFMSNMYYNGGYKYKADGKASRIVFGGADVHFKLEATADGSTGDTLSSYVTRFNIVDSTMALHKDAKTDNYTSFDIYEFGNGGSLIGVNTTTSDVMLCANAQISTSGWKRYFSGHSLVLDLNTNGASSFEFKRSATSDSAGASITNWETIASISENGLYLLNLSATPALPSNGYNVYAKSDDLFVQDSSGDSFLLNVWEKTTNGINYNSGNVGVGADANTSILTTKKASSVLYSSSAAPYLNYSIPIIVNNATSATNISTGIYFSVGDTNVSRGAIQLIKPSSSSMQTDFAVQLRSSTGLFMEAMRIKSTGRVGIGTSAPSEALDVNGVIRLENFASAPATPTNGANIYSSNGQLYAQDYNGLKTQLSGHYFNGNFSRIAFRCVSQFTHQSTGTAATFKSAQTLKSFDLNITVFDKTDNTSYGLYKVSGIIRKDSSTTTFNIITAKTSGIGNIVDSISFTNNSSTNFDLKISNSGGGGGNIDAYMHFDISFNDETELVSSN